MRPLVALLLLGAAGCPGAPEPTAAEVAAYFGLVDGAERVYEDASGLEETHEYERNGGFGEREVYERLVRRSGFLEDEGTFQLEASVERGLEITRLHDCVTRCGELSKPIALLPWPLAGGESRESEVEVTLTANGEDEGTRGERHRIQVGAEEEVTVPAGTYRGYRLVWTRTVGEEGDTLELFFAPGEGVVVTEGFDGARFELREAG